MTHDKAEIEATRMNQQALQDVRVAAQMGTAHPTRVVEMREGAFDPLAALAHQSASAWSANPPAIAIHWRLRVGRVRPVASTPVGLRHVGPNADRVEVHHRLIAVIALVADDLFQRLRFFHVGLRVFDLVRRGNRRFDDRRRVAFVSPLQRDRDNRAGVQVDGMLGFVRQMRPAVFYLRDLRVGVAMPDIFASPVKNT